MATVVSDGFFNFSKSFFSSDVLYKISGEIDQPLEQTKSGLKSVIPALLMGIVKKGSRQEGASELLGMAKKRFAQNQNNKSSMSGSDYLHGIFNENLSSVISKLSDTTGMNAYSISKMMGISAPLILGALGAKIKSENMDATSLMNYLSSQRSSLASLLPTDLAAIMSNRETGKMDAYSLANNRLNNGVGFNWGRVTLVALILLFFMWLFSSLFNTNNMRVIPLEEPEAMNRIVNLSIAPSVLNLAGVNALMEYLRITPEMDEWRRFRFNDLTFIEGTSAFLFEDSLEIDHIAEAMAIHPNTLARIEVYTDNVGPDTVNDVLAMDRAMAIKIELMNRGIDSNRIEAVGHGARNPVADNKTDEGRSQNRRIELVVRH